MRHGARLQPLWLAFLLMLTLLPAAPTSAQAYPLIVHNDPSYAGSWCYSDTPMAANIAASCNDQISSIQLQAGWSVRVNRDQNQSGPSFCLSRSDNNLGDNTFEDGSPADNAISSFALYSGAWCGGSPTPAYPLEVYNDPGYGGSQCYSWRAETATIFSLCDNQISSILLRAGWSIRLYADPGQAGPSRCLTGSDNNLADNTFENGAPIDNAASSFVLYSVGSCGGGGEPQPQPIYSISGRVTTTDGRFGILGVTITAAGPNTVTANTNNLGYYTFSNLPAGSYQLTATKPGFVFPPSSRNVQLPPSNTAVNFVAKGPVVVLVHGWQGGDFNSGGYDCDNGTFQRNKVNDFDDLPLRLEASGYLVYFAQWTTGFLDTMSRAEAAICLSNQLQEVVGNDSDGKVILITHSMGGLVSRSYIEGSLYQSNVDRLITVGTPHVGADIGVLGQLTGGLSSLVCVGKNIMGECELTVGRAVAYNITHRQRDGVRYDFITGTGGRGVWYWDFVLSRNVGPHDGIVGRYSGQGYSTVLLAGIPRRGLGSVRGNNITVYKTPDRHTGGWGNGYFDNSGYVGGAFSCISELLKLGSGACERDSTTPILSSEEATADTPPVAFTPGHNIALAAGESRTISLTLDGARASVVTIWDTGNVRTTLRTPDGAEVTPENVAALIPGASYETSSDPKGLTGGSYTLPAPVAGIWQVILTATDATTVRVAGVIESDLAANITPPSSVLPGATSIVTATMTNSSDGANMPVAGATVTGTLHTVGGPVDLVFKETATGIYSASFLAPLEPGEYSLVAYAKGVAPELFERQVNSSLLVLKPDVQLEGVADSGVADLDADGRFDTLRVTLPLNVTSPGSYSIGAELQTRDGKPVAQVVEMFEWDNGSQTATLDFAGSEIAAAGLDGPYRLAVMIVQAEGEQFVLDEPELVETAPYTSGEFETGRFTSYLPVLRK